MKLFKSSRWLRLGRSVVFGYSVILITLSLAGAVLFPAYASQHAAEFTPYPSWSSALTQAGLAQLGWPSAIPAYVHLGLSLLFLVAGGGVALLLLWRRPASWFILFLAFSLVSFFGGGKTLLTPLFARLPGLEAYSTFMISVVWQFFFIVFFFFPNGHAAPRWTGWVARLWLGLIALGPFLPLEFYETPVVQSFFFFGVFSALGSQFFRYFRRSDPVQRQQTKWVVTVLLLILVESLGFSLFSFTTPSGADLRSDLVLTLVKLVLDNLMYALIPVAIFLAITRYRLWDIDLVIRRTLLYSLLTFILGLVYVGLVTLLQGLFAGVSQQQSPVTIVLSTLVIYALFTPLRRRIQAVIDRRFFRQKYNAERVVAKFATAARSETALNVLTGHMVSVVEDTVQPQQVWVWMKDRKPEPK